MNSPPQPVTLTGRVVRLEPMTAGHLDALCEIGLDPALWEIAISPVLTREQMKGYVDSALQAQAEGNSLPFVIVEQSSGRLAGSTRFGNIVHEHRRLEIGWTWVARPWQRTAVNTEAKYLLLTHAFDALGYNRVELKTDLLNERSQAAMKRIGAVQEGIFRSHIITHTGRVRDSVYFSVIKSDWPAVKRGLEEKLARKK